MEKLTAEREAARDCRRAGATVAPCPVVYRNTRIEWRDRIETVRTPDPRQAARVAALSAELYNARRTIRNLERGRTMTQSVSGALAWQNGTRQFPYNTDERCPAGSVVIYDGGLGAIAVARRHSGDPGVCYVLTRQRRLAMALPRR